MIQLYAERYESLASKYNKDGAVAANKYNSRIDLFAERIGRNQGYNKSKISIGANFGKIREL
jgi:hypothetical protein